MGGMEMKLGRLVLQSRTREKKRDDERRRDDVSMGATKRKTLW